MGIFEDELRSERNKIWFRWATAALTNAAEPSQICYEWSQAASRLLEKAFHFCFDQEKAYKIALFALGKLGSRELNLSSDVDLLLVCDSESADALQALRMFQKVVGERTSHGFVFRLDFDLRPGGKQGPMIPTLEQLKDYYGNYGETWERMAFVRLRAITGDQQIIDQVNAFSKKMSYRRHIDFTLFEDLKNLRTKIHDHYWARSQNNTIDLKLGVGGIRDVELFAHALQIVHGGKDKSLQVNGTVEALNRLAEQKLLPLDEAQFLGAHYWNLRLLENYVQALDDEQTHLIKFDPNHPNFVNKAMDNIIENMKQCDQIVKSLLGDAPQESSSGTFIEEELKKAGLDQEDQCELWNEILDQEVLSHQRSRDELARKKFLHQFLNALKEQGGDRHRALLLLKDFIRGTRAKATFFALLLREPLLLKKLAWLFGHSAYLSRILCNRPELLDSFIYQSQDRHSDDMGQLLEELAEKKLLSELISGSAFLEDKNLKALLENLTSTADAIALTLLEALKKEYPSSLQILALGKWGGQEIGFRSDLDFIFVIPDRSNDNDFKVAKRFITRLTENHRGGNIFSIDMRLRPSGKAGPLVISLDDLQRYLREEAQPWERQAYLKSRWIGSIGPELSAEYLGHGLDENELAELEHISRQLISNSKVINLKFSEGGLVDLELASQTAILGNKEAPQGGLTTDFLRAMGKSGSILAQNYESLRQIEQLFQLVASESTSELNPNHESFQSLALVLQMCSEELLEHVQQILSNNIELLKELDPRRQPH